MTRMETCVCDLVKIGRALGIIIIAHHRSLPIRVIRVIRGQFLPPSRSTTALTPTLSHREREFDVICVPGRARLCRAVGRFLGCIRLDRVSPYQKSCSGEFLLPEGEGWDEGQSSRAVSSRSPDPHFATHISHPAAKPDDNRARRLIFPRGQIQPAERGAGARLPRGR
jgi:hypothetical protein